MRREILLVIILLSAACGGGNGDEAGTSSSASTTSSPPMVNAEDQGMVRAGSVDETNLGDPYLGPLTFVPPIDCSVVIEENFEKGGSDYTLGYSLEFTRSAGGTDVSFVDMRVLEQNGRAVPVDQQSLAALPFRLPTFGVNDDGLLVDITGTQEMIDVIYEADPEVAELMSGPAFIATIEDLIASKYWGVWVGFWAEWGSFEDTVEPGYIEGTDLEFTAESLGTTEDGLAVLRYTSVLQGPTLVESLRSVFESLVPSETSQDEMEEALATADGTMRDRFEVVTDPTTLWPESTYFERDIELTMEGETNSQLEKRAIAFGWDRSTC